MADISDLQKGPSSLFFSVLLFLLLFLSACSTSETKPIGARKVVNSRSGKRLSSNGSSKPAPSPPPEPQESRVMASLAGADTIIANLQQDNRLADKRVSSDLIEAVNAFKEGDYIKGYLKPLAICGPNSSLIELFTSVKNACFFLNANAEESKINRFPVSELKAVPNPASLRTGSLDEALKTTDLVLARYGAIPLWVDFKKSIEIHLKKTEKCKSGNYGECVNGVTWGTDLPTDSFGLKPEIALVACPFTSDFESISQPELTSIGYNLEFEAKQEFLKSLSRKDCNYLLLANQLVGFSLFRGELSEDEVQFLKGTYRRLYGAPKDRTMGNSLNKSIEYFTYEPSPGIQLTLMKMEGAGRFRVMEKLVSVKTIEKIRINLKK